MAVITDCEKPENEAKLANESNENKAASEEMAAMAKCEGEINNRRQSKKYRLKAGMTESNIMQ